MPGRRTFLGGAGALALGSLAPLPVAAEVKPDPAARVRDVDVQARALTSFLKSDGARTRFGRLEFAGGLLLTSNDNDFGGWSGLAIDGDGRRLAMVSDAGSWLTAAVERDRAGRLTGLKPARIGPLLGQNGQALARGRDRDAESITLTAGTLAKGTVLVAFEQNHRIGFFPVEAGGIGTPQGYLKLAPEARRMRANRGIEAVTTLAGGPLKGAVVAFCERFPDASGHHVGWLWAGPADPQRLIVRNTDEFDITDVVGTPDGGLILLERRFKWLEGIRMRLRRLGPLDRRAGVVLDGEVLIDADLGYEIDNMEGMSARRDARGQLVLTIVSDDNFNHFLQRTVMIELTLVDAGPGTAGR